MQYDNNDWQNKSNSFYVPPHGDLNKEDLYPIIDELQLNIEASSLANILNQVAINSILTHRSHQKSLPNIADQKRLLIKLEKGLSNIIPCIGVLKKYGFPTAALCINNHISDTDHYNKTNDFLNGLNKLKSDLEILKEKIVVGQGNLKTYTEKFAKKQGNTSSQAAHHLIATLANIYENCFNKKTSITTNINNNEGDYRGDFFKFVLFVKNIIEKKINASDHGYFPETDNAWGDMVKRVLKKRRECKKLQKEEY